MASPASFEGTLLRRNRLLLGLGLLPLASGPAAYFLAARLILDEAQAGAIPALGGLCGILGALLGYAMVHANPRKVPVAGTLTAGEKGVTFAGRAIAARRAILAGFLVLTPGEPPLVRFERRWPLDLIDLRLRDEADARALLRALDLDASRSVARFELASRTSAEPFSTIGGLLVFLSLFGAWAAAASALWFVAAGLLGVALVTGLIMTTPTRVIVGADGVLVSWLWQRRFVSYNDVRAVRPYQTRRARGVAISIEGGSTLELQFKPMARRKMVKQPDLLMQRIQQAIGAHQASRRERDVSLPERGGRAAVEWIRALRTAGSGARADHRTAPVAPEELWRVVEDPGATAAARAAAAIAVSTDLDAAGRTRLRIAAGATAAPEVRGLLELAAEEADEERLAAALGRLEER